MLTLPNQKLYSIDNYDFILLNNCILEKDNVITFKQLKYIQTWHNNNAAIKMHIDKYIIWYDLNLFYITGDNIYNLTDKVHYYTRLYNDDVLLLCNLVEDKVVLVFIAKNEAYNKKIIDINNYNIVRLAQ